jgi:phosphate starvation-inducible PhoH-like protein
MKMFLTRMGFSSKAVITGDITQIDLPSAKRSGLIEAMEILKNVEGISFVHFDETDVVRHHLVQRIVRAYEDNKNRTSEAQLSLSLNSTASAPRPLNADEESMLATPVPRMSSEEAAEI